MVVQASLFCEQVSIEHRFGVTKYLLGKSTRMYKSGKTGPDFLPVIDQWSVFDFKASYLV